MPIPGGEITTSDIWNNPNPEKQNEKTQKPEEKTDEQERLDIAIKIQEGEL